MRVVTDDELAAIRARAEAAEPGPWMVDCVEDDEWYWGIRGPKGRELVIGSCANADVHTGEFIAAAREDVPALLAEVERLRAGLQAVIAAYDAEPGFVAGPDYWNGLQEAGAIAADVLGVTV